MITGTVNRRHEVVITLLVRDSTRQEHEIESILDTGFTGSLTLPPSLIESLGLVWRSRSSAILANGNIEEFDLYVAAVIWDAHERQILIQAIENAPLLGMAMLVGYDLRVRVIVGGSVEIEAVRQQQGLKMYRHLGSNFDDFLSNEGLLADAEAVAIKRVVAFQIAQMMRKQRISKTAMARRMKTSRSALDRLLDPENGSVTLQTLERAALALGKRLRVEFAA